MLMSSNPSTISLAFCLVVEGVFGLKQLEPLNTDTLLIQTLPLAPSLSVLMGWTPLMVLMGFDCIILVIKHVMLVIKHVLTHMF